VQLGGSIAVNCGGIDKGEDGRWSYCQLRTMLPKSPRRQSIQLEREKLGVHVDRGEKGVQTNTDCVEGEAICTIQIKASSPYMNSPKRASRMVGTTKSTCRERSDLGNRTWLWIGRVSDPERSKLALNCGEWGASSKSFSVPSEADNQKKNKKQKKKKKKKKGGGGIL